MTWQIAALLVICGMLAAGMLLSISAMLALRIGDAVISAWRWCWGRL
ncbi:MAG: hypothetical protein J0H42_04290 [Rhizobiales bacterium]|nr:hypothetical protein [Hyphomicrobiales bacterium]